MRIGWVDTAKGMGLFLVILGHLWYISPIPIVNTAIYSFHMPMFFILSGFVYKYKPGLRAFATKKAKRLLVPTLFFVILGLCLCPAEKIPANIQSYLLFWNGLIVNNAPCWFLIVLFEVYIMHHCLQPCKQKTLGKALLMTAFFVAGYYVYHKSFFIPFGLNRAIIAAGFFTMGEMLRGLYDLNVIPVKLAVLSAAVATAIWFVAGVILNGKVSFYNFALQNY